MTKALNQPCGNIWHADNQTSDCPDCGMQRPVAQPDVVWQQRYGDDLMLVWVRRDGEAFRAGYHNREYKCTFGRLQDATDAAIQGAIAKLSQTIDDMKLAQRELIVVRSLKGMPV